MELKRIIFMYWSCKMRYNFIVARGIMSLLLGYIIGSGYQLKLYDLKFALTLCFLCALVLIVSMPKKS